MDNHTVHVCLWIYFAVMAFLCVIFSLSLVSDSDIGDKEKKEKEYRRTLTTAGLLYLIWTIIFSLIVIGVELTQIVK